VQPTDAHGMSNAQSHSRDVRVALDGRVADTLPGEATARRGRRDGAEVELGHLLAGEREDDVCVVVEDRTGRGERGGARRRLGRPGPLGDVKDVDVTGVARIGAKKILRRMRASSLSTLHCTEKEVGSQLNARRRC
jgi:hypothetical protein